MSDEGSPDLWVVDFAQGLRSTLDHSSLIEAARETLAFGGLALVVGAVTAFIGITVFIFVISVLVLLSPLILGLAAFTVVLWLQDIFKRLWQQTETNYFFDQGDTVIKVGAWSVMHSRHFRGYSSHSTNANALNQLG